MRFLLTLLISVVLSLLGIYAYKYFSRRQPEITDPFRLHVMNTALERIVQDLPDPAFPQVMCLLPLTADVQGVIITRALARKLDDSGKYRCLSIERVRQHCREGNIALTGQAKRLQVARHFNADVAGFGKVVCFSKTVDGSELGIRFWVYSLAAKRYVLSNKLFFGKLERGWSLAYYRAWIASRSLSTRLWIWLLLTVLPAFVLYKPVAKFLNRRSNLVNFYLLVAFSTWSTLIAIAFCGFALDNWANLLAVSAALVVGLHILLCSF